MKLVIIALLSLLTVAAKAQDTGYNLPPKTFYKNAKITLKDFTKYECKNLSIKADSVSFFNSNTNQNQSIALSNIDYFRVQEGNQALKWGGLGALLFGLSAVLTVTDDDYYYDSTPSNVDSGPFIIGFTLGGAAIGALIGLAIPKWKTYYLNY